MSAALPGVAAAHSDLPVVGVPISGKTPRGPRRAALGGADAARRPGRLRRDRRRQERRGARSTNNQLLNDCEEITPASRSASRPGMPGCSVIARYTREEIGGVWSPHRKMDCWLAVELAATDALAAEGIVPAEAAEACRSRASFTVEAVEERERTTNHDVAAFVDVVAAQIGPEGRWIHYGLTSSDVLDTALALQIEQAGIVLPAGRDGLPRRPGAARLRAPRHALRRPHPRRPRRADHLRAAAGRLRLRGRPQPEAAAPRGRGRRGRQALRAPSAPTPRSAPRSRSG